MRPLRVLVSSLSTLVAAAIACSFDDRPVVSSIDNDVDELEGGTLCDARPEPCAAGSVCEAATGDCLPSCNGCNIGDVCFAERDENPTNACELCDPDTSPSGWVAAPSNTACNDDDACTHGDHCSAGHCEGTPLVCEQGWSCDVARGVCANGNGGSGGGEASGMGGEASASGGSGGNGTGGSEPAGSGGSANGTGGSGAGGSANGGSGGANAGSGGSEPEPCDSTAFPASDDCVINETFGVFVAPNGDDSAGDGSRSRPFGTLARAAEVASARDRRVYACATAGAFEERLQLDDALDGLQLFGGFSCDDWSYDVALAADVDSPFTTAIELAGVSGVRFENFVFSSLPATTPGTSSIAARIVDSQNVTFVRTTFLAGNGAAGTAGQNGTLGANGATPGGPRRGPDADCLADIVEDGPPGASNACGSTSGNGGGTVPPPIPIGFFGGAGAPGPENGGIPSEVLGENGGNGGNGVAGPSGQNAAVPPTIGTFGPTGYTPPNAAAGALGGAGQGGGGGAAGNAFDESDFCRQALGGAGGLGGCGGTGGTGGRGGGASVAMLSWNSQVSLNACELRAASGGRGGNGGNGGAGGNGEAGAPGGAGTVQDGVLFLLSGDGGNGGRGGNGGTGGGGAGAAGGPAVGVVFQGDAPAQVNGTLVQAQSGGAGGTGGLGGSGRAANGPQGSPFTTLRQ